MGLSESLQRAIDHFGGHDDHDEYDDYREYGHEDETGVACEHVRLRHEQRSERRRRHAGRGSAAGGLYDQGSADGGISSGESFARPLALVRPEPTEFGSFTPHSFGEAQQIADRFLSGVPVFVELGSCDAVLAGRVLDFCSGLICAVRAGCSRSASAPICSLRPASNSPARRAPAPPGRGTSAGAESPL